MKICIAQTRSWKGNIQKNIENHLRIIKDADENGADIVVFPEMSITNYETDLADVLPIQSEDTVFDVFQNYSNINNIIIGIGTPLSFSQGTYISLLFFQPNKNRIAYHKQMLHADEDPYFICGSEQKYIDLKGKKIAFGICYESLQAEHFLYGKENGADIYIASVAKHYKGVEIANLHFSKLSKDYRTPILMANSIGFCDTFLSTGNSAVWNNGNKVGMLDDKNQGMLIFDTETKTVQKIVNYN